MKPLLFIVAATLCFAAAEPSRDSLKLVERTTNERFAPSAVDTYDLEGMARASYLQGYGVLVTFELGLIQVMPPNPFSPEITPAQKVSIHDRKVKKLQALRADLQKLMADAGASLTSVPANEKIVFEVFLWNFSWENTQGIPRRLRMSTTRQKLMDAAASHADLKSVITEEAE